MILPAASSTRRRTALTVLAAVAACLAAPLQAQNFEAHYGLADRDDRAEDVKSVRQCPGRGSILAGTRATSDGTEVLVSRVDDIGAPLWQYAYRIGDVRSSAATAIVELRGGVGFALTGAATDDQRRIFAMRIDCDGRPEWTLRLRNLGDEDRAVGYDVLEVPNVAGGPPDLLIVGEEARPNGHTFGRIARLTAAGGFVYDNAYIEPQTRPGIRFRAATLAPSSSGAPEHVVIAGSAGRHIDWNFDRRGLMFRAHVNGTPLCNAMLGDANSGSEDYHGVDTMRAAPYAGQTVLVGVTAPATALQAQQVYLTRFRAGSCVPLVQAAWRFPDEGATAFDIDENSGMIAGFGPGLVATGTVSNGGDDDGFLGWTNPANLFPVIPLQRFGTQSLGQPGAPSEQLRALDLAPDRYLLAGRTSTDWDGSGDPGDFYFAQTTPFFATQCSIAWTVLPHSPAYPYARFQPLVREVKEPERVETPRRESRGDGYCCAPDPA